ncbi:MAG: hypothetical protein AB7O65_08275 [Candidatus Korobacteraceae bacterium]
MLATVVVPVSALAAQSYAPISAGARIEVRINESLSSAKSDPGDRFTGTLVNPEMVNGRALFPKGADVTGEIVAVERSGRLSDPGELHLELRTLQVGGRTYQLFVEPFLVKGESHTKSNITKIGGGAAAGAIIGAVAGGGKGAAVGAGVGAAGGTAVAAATGKKEALVESEAVLVWVAAQPPGPSLATSGVTRASRRYPETQPRNPRSLNETAAEFTERDRRVILGCFGDGGRNGLPPGLAKRDRLPPGLERQVQRNGTLPPGLQKKVQPLPRSCEARLSPLPEQWARGVLNGRVLLLDARFRILDLFSLNN